MNMAGKTCYLLKDSLVRGEAFQAGDQVELEDRDYLYFINNKLAQDKKPKPEQLQKRLEA